MRAISSKTGRPIPVGAKLKVVDNSGAKIVKVISVKKYGGVKRRLASAGIGDIIVASVQSGKPGMKKQIVMATIVRQKKEFRRMNGLRVKFEDNAAILISDEIGTPKGSRVKGPVAKEVLERFPSIGKIVSMVV